MSIFSFTEHVFENRALMLRAEQGIEIIQIANPFTGQRR